MSEKTEDKVDQEPAPIKESDANRVTSNEADADRAEKGREQESPQDSDSSRD